mgnify:CR=1 FL=1
MDSLKIKNFFQNTKEIKQKFNESGAHTNFISKSNTF